MKARKWALAILVALILGGLWFTMLFGPPPVQGEPASHLATEMWTLYKIVVMVYAPIAIIILIWPFLWPLRRRENAKEH